MGTGKNCIGAVTHGEVLAVHRWQYIGSIIAACCTDVFRTPLPMQMLGTDCSGVRVEPLLHLIRLPIGECTRRKTVAASQSRICWRSNIVVLSTLGAPLDTLTSGTLSVSNRAFTTFVYRKACSRVVSFGAMLCIRLVLVVCNGMELASVITHQSRWFFRHASCFSRMHHWDQSLLVDGVLRGDRRREPVAAVTRSCRELGLAIRVDKKAFNKTQPGYMFC